jgi:uncharacterized membrane protein
MTRYELLLFLHVATAIIWLGAGTVIQFFAFRAERSRDAVEVHRVASDSEWLTMRLFVPSSLAVLVLGIALVLDGPWGFDQLWITLGLAGYGFSFLVGILFLGPESGRIAKLVETHGVEHELVTSRIGRILAVSRFELAVLFAVVLDMTLKPTADDAGFWALAAAILVVGAGFGLWSYRGMRGAKEAVA